MVEKGSPRAKVTRNSTMTRQVDGSCKSLCRYGIWTVSCMAVLPSARFRANVSTGSENVGNGVDSEAADRSEGEGRLTSPHPPHQVVALALAGGVLLLYW